MRRGRERRVLALGALSRLQEPPWIEVQAIRDALDGLEGEVPLAALDAAEVGPVHADEFSEVLLGQAAALTVRTQVLSEGPLKDAFHGGHRDGLLLFGLQTDK
jgi:hypothetical protein